MTRPARFALLGVLFVGALTGGWLAQLGMVEAWHLLALQKRGVVTGARVEGTRETPDGRLTNYEVRYSLEVEGKRFSPATGWVTLTSGRYVRAKELHELEVTYLPDDPRINAVTGEFDPLDPLAGMSVGVALATICGAAIFWLTRRS